MSLIDHQDHTGNDADAGEPAGKPAGRIAAARTGARVRRSEAERARQDAMGLLPELPAARPRKKRHRLVALVTTLAALTLVVVLFGGAWQYAQFQRQVGAQETTSASLTGAQEAAYRGAAEQAAAAPAGTGTAPVVLAYHDIAPESDSKFVVTPKAFADQLAMLREAGYTTLTAEQFTAYAKGEYTPPPRSAFITFDDGTSGLYTYGDKILEDNGFHAISFLITARVGTHAPYYLTWQQIQRMQESGRWSFGSHTATMHTRVPVGPEGTEVGSVLTHREFERGRQESYQGFTERVRADLEKSVADFTENDLPRPQLFAWPFSEVTAAAEAESDPRPLAFTRSEVERLFAASFVNGGAAPRPAVAEDVQAGLVERYEIFRPDTADDLFAGIARMEQLPESPVVPNEAAPTWLQPTGDDAPVALDGAAVRIDAPEETYVKANWAPQRTSEWSSYAVEARITGLSAQASVLGQPTPASNSAGLRARVGQVGEVQARTSSTWINVTRGEESVYSAPMPLPGAASTLRMEVTPVDTLVLVDGREVARIPVAPGAEQRVAAGSTLPGSLGIVSQRGDDPAAPCPSVEDLTAGPLG